MFSSTARPSQTCLLSPSCNTPKLCTERIALGSTPQKTYLDRRKIQKRLPSKLRLETHLLAVARDASYTGSHRGGGAGVDRGDFDRSLSARMGMGHDSFVIAGAGAREAELQWCELSPGPPLLTCGGGIATAGGGAGSEDKASPRGGQGFRASAPVNMPAFRASPDEDQVT